MTLINFINFFEKNKYPKKLLSLILMENIEKQKNFLSFETRRRLQLYSVIDYFIFTGTFYDFISPNLLKVFVRSKVIAYFLGKKRVTSDMLVYSLYLQNTGNIKEMKFLKNIIEQLLWNTWNLPMKRDINYYFSYINSFPLFIRSLLKPFLFQVLLKYNKYIYHKLKFFKFNISKKKPTKKIKKIFKNINEIKFSTETYKILILTLKQSIINYHTPIIFPELLFINIIETKNSLGYKLLNKIFVNSSQRAQIRYQNLKKIYCIEARSYYYMPRNLFLYDYLLKSRSSEDLFLKVSFDPLIHIFIVLFFRLKLLYKILPYKFLKYLKYKSLLNLHY
jgi:hypothetical protein